MTPHPSIVIDLHEGEAEHESFGLQIQDGALKPTWTSKVFKNSGLKPQTKGSKASNLDTLEVQVVPSSPLRGRATQQGGRERVPQAPGPEPIVRTP